MEKVMAPRYKRVIAVLHGDAIFLECPFCGKTLVRTNYEKMGKVIAAEGTPRGKICPKCGDVAVLKFSSEVKQAIQARLAQFAQPSSEAPTIKIEDAFEPRREH